MLTIASTIAAQVQHASHRKPRDYEEAIELILRRLTPHQVVEIRNSPSEIYKRHVPEFVEGHWLKDSDDLYRQFKRDGIHDRMLMSTVIMRWIQMRIAGEKIDFPMELEHLKKKQAELDLVLQNPPKE